ncbi:uncharacterized protein [Miscanthus floridulus]|uniref:uncharacterized protein n=1 Tax=Miscanthus floridulus TaxID=154761 RepID=UPI00345B0E14
MGKKYGTNWKIEHPELDASVIYECAGRMPHGKLGIGDGAISIAEKEAIKTRKRSAQPYVSAKEKRLERENLLLRKEYSNLEHVVRALVAKQGMDFDALAQETTTNLPTSESEVAFAREHEKIVPNASDHDNIGGADYSGEENIGGADYSGEENEDDIYDYDDEGYHSQDDGQNYENNGEDFFDDDASW